MKTEIPSEIRRENSSTRNRHQEFKREIKVNQLSQLRSEILRKNLGFPIDGLIWKIKTKLFKKKMILEGWSKIDQHLGYTIK